MQINNHKDINSKIKCNINHNNLITIIKAFNNMECHNNKQLLKWQHKYYKKYVHYQHVMVHKLL